jgi:hypothetical protein
LEQSGTGLDVSTTLERGKFWALHPDYAASTSGAGISVLVRQFEHGSTSVEPRLSVIGVKRLSTE